MTYPSPTEGPSTRIERLTRRHLLAGWGTLLIFSLLGVALEALLAFKVSGYVHLEHEGRRTMWRLAHAHGTLFALLHFAYVASLRHLPAQLFPQPMGVSSGLLTAATVLIPGGFLLAGWGAHGPDPGAAIALVPAGALALLAVCLLVLIGLARRPCGRATPDVDDDVAPPKRADADSDDQV